MRTVLFTILSFLLLSCEEVIDIDLHDASPRYVIEADINNLSDYQQIRISETVAFGSAMPYNPISHATVTVRNDRGQVYNFVSAGDGNYRNDNFIPRIGRTYTLEVQIGNEVFTATDNLDEYIDIDSVGVMQETFFGEDNYSVLFKFTDPINTPNYYKYLVSVNGAPFKFLQVYDDKYNDGLYVSHQLSDFNDAFELGDTVVVRRQIVSQPVFRYWNEFQFLNPGNAAPANPTSNISNGALGYFSVTNEKIYGITIRSQSNNEN